MSKFRLSFTAVVCAAVLLFVANPPTFGQASFEAQLRGTISDPTGAVVAGAKVILTNAATGIRTTGNTNAEGIYTFNSLRPGTYDLRVESTGFAPFESTGLVLAVSQQAVFDVDLKVGSLASEITVTAAAPLLDSGSANIGTTVSGESTRSIPLYGRSFFGLVFLAGGVTESPGSGVNDSYPSGTNFISNGQRNATAEVRLDGALTSAPEQGEGGNTNVYYQPSVEVIQEFKVSNNSFSAEFGNNGGTVLNVVMKQGGNQFHGSGWWFGQRSGLDANDFFSNAAGLPRPPHKHDQYGFMLNGPIKREKTFFLFDLERVKDSSPIQISTTVPTLAERAGDFSRTFYADEHGEPVQNVIYDPKSGLPGERTPFPSNIIPAEQQDPIGVAVAALYPQPNQAGDPIFGTNNFRDNIVGDFKGYQLDGKVDHQFNDSQRLSVRYSHLDNTSTTPTLFGTDDGTIYKTNVHNAVAGYTWAMRPTVVLDARIGLDRVDAPGISNNYPDLRSVGFPEVLAANGLFRMPMIQMADGPYSGLFTQCCVDTWFAHTLYNYSGSVSWIRGAHSFKFGGEQRLFYNSFGQPDSPTGTFTFSQITTANDPFSGDVTQGNPIAGLLIGYGTEDSYITVRPRVADKSTETAFYVQDDWKVSRRLTLNLGLRYEWSRAYSERFDRVQFNDFNGDSGITIPGLPLAPSPIKGTTIFAGPGQRTIPVDRNNIAPRAGFAFALTPNTVIRGGGGIYYGMNIATNFQYAGPAFAKSQPIRFSLDGYESQYATLGNPFPQGLPPAQGNKYGPLALWGFSNSSDLSWETNRNAEIYQWSVGIQRLLPRGIVVSADYSANRSAHLPWGSWGFTRNRNFIPSSVRSGLTSDELSTLVANPFQPLFTGPGAIFNEPDSLYNNAEIPLLNLLRPYPQFDGEFTGLPLLAANSRYNSLQLRFAKNIGRYFTFQGDYTVARYNDDSSVGSNDWLAYYSLGAPQAPDRLENEYGISANDATHHMSAVAEFAIPFGRGLRFGTNTNRAVDWILGGWNLSSTITLQSGQPIAVGMSLPRLADGNQRPNVSCSDPGTGISYHEAAATGQPFINSGCFSDPGDQQLGDAPRYFEELRLHGIRRVDAALRKEFAITERARLQVRFESFNLFNRTRFGAPNSAWGDSTFGQVTSLAPGSSPRRSQIVARFEF